LSLKVGKFGAFVGCSKYPDCKFTRPLGTNGEGAENGNGEAEDKILGVDDGDNILLRIGRFGPYIQRGDPDSDNKAKPPRAGIPKDMPVESVDLEKALMLLSLPRDVGAHPETGKQISAAIGRYGPYLRHDGKSATLPSSDEVFTIGINRAVTVLAEAKPGQRQSQVLKALGDHPDDGAPVNVMNGRFGPYVKHGKINATLTKGYEPDTITMDEAVALIAAKAAKPPKKKKAAAKKKKTTKKKTAKKKSAA
jgi:DNA topoisomerase-1